MPRRPRRRLVHQFAFRSGTELVALVFHSILGENVCFSFLPPAPATISGQCLPTQIIRRYHKDAAWLWIRYVYDSKIASRLSLPNGYSRSFFSLTILTGSRQYFFHLILVDVMTVDVWQARFWIDVVANVPNSHIDGSRTTLSSSLLSLCVLLPRVPNRSGESSRGTPRAWTKR